MLLLGKVKRTKMEESAVNGGIGGRGRGRGRGKSLILGDLISAFYGKLFLRKVRSLFDLM